MNKLSKMAPAWHAKVIAEIEREFAETNELTETARRRRARLGMMLIWIKAAGKADGSIPHGEFGPWLKKHLPAIPAATAGKYITEAKSICDLLQWQISRIEKFETPPHKLLLAKAEDLSPEDRAHQKELFKIIDEQSHFQAVTEYKQVQMVDDATVARRGRRPGEGGKPAAPTGTVEEILAHAQKTALRKMGLADKFIQALSWEFMALDDDAVLTFCGTLERSVTCMKRWLNTPTTKRDPKEIVKLWKQL